jgi:hypothetical protein
MRVRTRRTHRVADRLAHAPHLTVAALVDGEAHQPGLDRATLAGAVIPSSSSTPSRSRRRAPRGRALDVGQVLLVHAERRVGEAVGQVAVVGEQQQALGVGVEATDREDPRLVGHHLEHGGTALGSSAVVTTPAGLFSR